MNKVLLFSAVVISLFAACQTADKAKDETVSFVGKWAWEKTSEVQSFSIEILQRGDSLLGKYCIVSNAGEKMNCSMDDKDFSFGFRLSNEKTVTFPFKSYKDDDKGKATLTLEGNKLLWHLAQAPKSEHYLLENATLLRFVNTK
jgi:hypothetical protein